MSTSVFWLDTNKNRFLSSFFRIEQLSWLAMKGWNGGVAGPGPGFSDHMLNRGEGTWMEHKVEDKASKQT